MITRQNLCPALTAVILTLLASACGQGHKEPAKLTSAEIDSRYASGVVLIQNTYCHAIEFDGAQPIYFTLDEENNVDQFTLDPSELKPKIGYGTGFFVSRDGLIATNSHVANPAEGTESVRNMIIAALQEWANEGSKEINELNENLGMLKVAAAAANTQADRAEAISQYNQLSSKRDAMQEIVNAFNALGTRDYKLTTHVNIGIAYNDTHVTGTDDFIDCVLVTDDPEHDLGIIQLKDKKTPEGKHIFAVKTPHNPTEKQERKRRHGGEKQQGNSALKVGKKLYMIGFNLGPGLAVTDQGIKAQINSGEISQNTDSAHVLYSIPTLPGSSGSPVIDEFGNLVAINFAGLQGTQNFNYGIKVQHLAALLQSLKDND